MKGINRKAQNKKSFACYPTIQYNILNHILIEKRHKKLKTTSITNKKHINLPTDLVP